MGEASHLLIYRLLLTFLISSTAYGAIVGQTCDVNKTRVLMITRARNYVHDAIPSAISMMEKYASERGWDLTVADDIDEFIRPKRLQRYSVVALVLTTGNIFNDEQRETFREYMENGGGLVAVHSAVSDTNSDWDWHNHNVGPRIKNHPHPQTVQVHTTWHAHSSTDFMPKIWPHFDEYYNYAVPFKYNDFRMILKVDGTTYDGGSMHTTHPVSWTRMIEPEGGRVWSTVLGHMKELYTGRGTGEELFQMHLALGIEWAAKERDN